MTEKSHWRHPMAPQYKTTPKVSAEPVSSAQLPFVHPKPLHTNVTNADARAPLPRNAPPPVSAPVAPHSTSPKPAVSTRPTAIQRPLQRVNYGPTPVSSSLPSWQLPTQLDKTPTLEEVWYRETDAHQAPQSASDKLFEPSEDSLADRFKTWRAKAAINKAAKILGEPDLAVSRAHRAPGTPGRPMPGAAQPARSLSSKLAAVDPRSSNYRRPGALAVPKPEPQTVNIQIQIPTISLERIRAAKDVTLIAAKKIGQGKHRATAKLTNMPRLHYRRVIIAVSAIFILAIAGFTGLRLQQAGRVSSAKANTEQASSANGAALSTTPSFTPVKSASPEANPAAGTATKQQTSYDGSKDTYSFTDTLDGKSVLVSQQPIPAKFKSATEAVSTVAASLGAKESTTTNDGMAYIATEAKSNSQTVVFTKNGLLLFIQSPFTHNPTEWGSYINSLKS